MEKSKEKAERSVVTKTWRSMKCAGGEEEQKCLVSALRLQMVIEEDSRERFGSVTRKMQTV
jgi:hypothetical protein